MKGTKKKSWLKPSTLVIAGIGVAAMAGTYWFFSRQDFTPASPPPPTPDAPPAARLPVPAQFGPDLKGPRVTKGKDASTRTQIKITAKYPGMKYARIKRVDAEGFQVFTPPVSGIFTRRLLSMKGNLWAEIKPA